MKYTKKQRNEIYRKALDAHRERVEVGCRASFLCFRCDDAAGRTLRDADIPELFLFEPLPEEREYNNGWWHIDDHKSRENALLFCIEMTA